MKSKTFKFSKSFNKLIQSHLKIHKGIIIFFGITWLVLSIIIISVAFSNGSVRIADWYEDGVTYGTADGLGSLNQNWLLGALGMSFFAVVSLVLSNITFSKEIKNNNIVFWKTLPVSKINIFFSKSLFVIFINLMIFAPTFIYDSLVAFISKDLSQNGSYIFVYLFQFILFIILISVVMTSLAIALGEKNTILNIVGVSIILFIIFTWIFDLLYQIEKNSGNLQPAIKNIHYLSYISIESLISNNLFFVQPSSAWEENLPFYSYDHVDLFPAYQIAIKTISMPILSIGLLFLSNMYFGIKDFNI